MPDSDEQLHRAHSLRHVTTGAAVVLFLLTVAASAPAQVSAGEPGGLDPRLLSGRDVPSSMSTSIGTIPTAAAPTPVLARTAQATPSDDGRPSVPVMIAGGLLGGGIGVLGGGYLGAAIVDDTCEGEGCFAGIIQGAFIGAVAAESVLLPLGVHVAAGGEGDYGTSALASLGLGAAAVGLAYATNLEGPGAGIVLAIPVAQLGISIAEHR